MSIKVQTSIEFSYTGEDGIQALVTIVLPCDEHGYLEKSLRSNYVKILDEPLRKDWGGYRTTPEGRHRTSVSTSKTRQKDGSDDFEAFKVRMEQKVDRIVAQIEEIRATYLSRSAALPENTSTTYLIR